MFLHQKRATKNQIAPIGLNSDSHNEEWVPPEAKKAAQTSFGTSSKSFVKILLYIEWHIITKLVKQYGTKSLTALFLHTSIVFPL